MFEGAQPIPRQHGVGFVMAFGTVHMCQHSVFFRQRKSFQDECIRTGKGGVKAHQSLHQAGILFCPGDHIQVLLET